MAPAATIRWPITAPTQVRGGVLNLNAPPGYYDGGALAGSRRQVEIQMEQRNADAEELRDRLTRPSNLDVAWRQACVSSTDARADHDLAPLRLQEVPGYQCQPGSGRLA